MLTLVIPSLAPPPPPSFFFFFSFILPSFFSFLSFFSTRSGRDGTVAEVDEAYPLAAAAKGTVVHVAAGDALLIPCGWWHRVDSTADGSVGYHFMVNTFFDMPVSAET